MPPKPAQASATPPSPPILGLRVSEEADKDMKNTAIPETDTRYLATAAVLDLGLRILESPSGKAALEAIGTKLVNTLKDHEHLFDKKDRSPRNTIPDWTALFLTRLRATFPSVVLTNHLGGEGQVSRSNWADPSKPNSKMTEWDPSSAGLFRLNKYIMEGLISAGQLAMNDTASPNTSQEAFESFMFLMAITVAHELCHLYVGFFVGYDRPQTPEKITFLAELYNTRSFNGDMIGESGRAWEGMVLGGIVDSFENPTHPFRSKQPGMMYIIDEHKVARRVPSSYIKALLGLTPQVPNLKLLDPQLAAQPGQPLADIDKKYKTMKEVRQGALKAGGVIMGTERSRSVAKTDLAPLNKRSKCVIRDRSRIGKIPLHPKYLFVAA